MSVRAKEMPEPLVKMHACVGQKPLKSVQICSKSYKATLVGQQWNVCELEIDTVPVRRMNFLQLSSTSWLNLMLNLRTQAQKDLLCYFT